MINVEHFLNRVAKRRGPSAIRSLMPLMKIPGMISFAGGLPNANTFPFHSCTMKMKDGTVIDISAEQLSGALQYGPTDGLPELVQWVKNHQQAKHNPQVKEWNVLITTGSQDALSKTFEMLIDEQDAVLVENPTYSGALAALKPLGPQLLEVDIDGQGIIPDALQTILESRKKNNLSAPKFLYTIPVGQNPSGATLSVDRKKKIYALAQQYNFLILEDDPYYYLTLDEDAKQNAKHSFLSMDVDGRVLRFDSLSKVLSSGLRLGWVTGASSFIQYLNYHMQANELHTSSMSQTVAYALLKQWGDEGLKKHVEFVQDFYRKRRDMFVELVEKNLKGYVEYSKPTAGMFLWMKLLDTNNSKSLIETKARDKLVLLVPGQAFQPNDKATPFIRASFSIESQENMDKGLQRLASLLKEVRESK
jgi:kynurenine/2-aminoadipate aminotransferase